MNTVDSEFLPACRWIWCPCPNAQQPWEAHPLNCKVNSKAAFVCSYSLWGISVFWRGGSVKEGGGAKGGALTLPMYWIGRTVMVAGDCKYMQLLLDEFTCAQCVLQDTMNSSRTDCDKQSGWRKFCLQWNFSSCWLSPTFLSIFQISFFFICALNYAVFLNIIRAVYFQYFLFTVTSIIDLIYYCQ